jgi:hypothetical protein
MRKWFTRRVLPGLLDVIASFLLLQSMFISEDLPTLDLPMNANSGNFCFGFSDILVLLPENNASVIFIFYDGLKNGRKDRKFILFISLEMVARVRDFLLNLLRLTIK